MLRFLIVSLSCILLVAADCQFHATIFRQLRKEGFHLELVSYVEIVIGGNECPPLETCTLALAENISSSFFVKPSELSQSIVGCSLGKFDVEEPEWKAKPDIVYLYSPLQVTLNLVQTNFVLPLHLRYHYARDGGGYLVAALSRPKLLLQCNQLVISRHAPIVQAPCPFCSPKSCNWVDLDYKTNTGNFTVTVPVGDTNYLPLVTIVTYLLAFGGCFFLSLTAIKAASVKKSS